MSFQVHVTCDHPNGCAEALVVEHCISVTDILREMVDHGWYNTVRLVAGKPARCDLCPSHKSWRPELIAR